MKKSALKKIVRTCNFTVNGIQDTKMLVRIWKEYGNLMAVQCWTANFCNGFIIKYLMHNEVIYPRDSLDLLDLLDLLDYNR